MQRHLLALALILLATLSYSQKKKAEQFFESGKSKFDLKDYSGAIADFTEAIKVNPKYAEAFYKRGIAKSWLGDNRSALEDLQEALKYKHNYQEAYFESAFVKYELKDYYGAIADYTKSLELKPTDRDAYYNRGLAKYSTGDYAGSISDNSKAIEIDPTYKNAYYNRSLARYNMKDYKGTIADCELLIKIDPYYTNAHYYVGLGYYYQGDYELSIQSYNKVIELKSDYTDAYYNRGLSKHYAKDYEGAVKDFTKVLTLDPKDDESYYRRGLSNYYNKNLQGAAADYERALHLNPEFEAAKKELAFVQDELKEVASKTGSDSKRNIEAENINFDVSNVKLPQIWAVVVGVSEYKDTKMNLKYADKDAVDFYNFLKSPNGGSLSDDHVTLLTNDKATRSNIIKALNEKFYRAFEDDIVILFMASHGAPDPVGNEVYFMSHDAESDNLGGTAVSQLDIEKVFQRTRAKKKLWIADACHSGGAGLQVRGAEQSMLTNKLLNEIANANNGMAMFTASSSSEYSHEDGRWGGGHGVFTHYLLKGLQGEADKDNNGLVELRELYEFVYRQVSHDTNGQQHPELKGSFDNKLPVAVHK